MLMENLPCFTLFGSLFMLSILRLSFAADTITPKQSIGDNETLVSSSQIFELGFFSPGSSKNRYLGIWYKNSPGTVVWVANRNNPLTDLHGVLTIGNDGNLVLLNQTKSMIWSSNVSGIVADPVAQLLDSGNFVVRDNESSTSAESYHWQSFDHPSDTLLPGMKLGWNLSSGQETYLTSWKSFDDPSPGDFTYRLDIEGLPQLCLFAGSVKKFRTGPWNGIFFGGTPAQQSSVFKPIVVQNRDELYYTYEILNKSIITRLTLNPSGLALRLVMYDWNAEWTNTYSSSMDLCNTYGRCGSNAFCRTSRTPFCECLEGFVRTFQGEWDVNNWSGVTKCKRKLTADCQRGERFVKLEWIQLPDFLEFKLNENMSLKECEAECSKNCSCRAYTNLNVSKGDNGCLMWFGDLIDIREQSSAFKGEYMYIRVPTSGLDSNKKKRIKTIAVVSISTISGIFILGLVSCLCWKKIKRKGMEGGREDVEIPLFNFYTIASATNNFSQANIIGEGGFGPVYKGKLLTGQDIAVKRLSKNSGQGIDEFRNEVVLIAKLQHRNLVGLLGCCMEGEERMLIYEYMPNKSLDYFIFAIDLINVIYKGWKSCADHTRSASLSWEKRFNIVLGIAKGLLYLHQDSKLQIVHRDLKASNILLDSNLMPKISDFGLARIFGADDSVARTKRVVGTYGYLSPEYAVDGRFSVKSDVFSLGVLLLEIVSSRRNRGFCHPDHDHNLLGHAWLLWNEGRALELMDAGIGDSHVKSQVIRCIQVGLLCVQKLPKDRPAMSSVVFMLSNEHAELSQPKEPGFFIERGSATNTTAGKQEQYSENSISLTMLEAR